MTATELNPTGRVGICEDDPRIRRLIAEALTADGHDTVAAHDGGEAMRLFAGDGSLRCIVLDIGLPDADGRDVCQALRGAGQTAPVLFLTARDALHDIVSGFGAGGDDYLAKPFAVQELRVRVGALVRRSVPAHAPEHGVTLDPARFALQHLGHEVAVTPTEFRMFAALLARPGEVVRRRDLVAAGWPMGAIVQENTIDSYIRRLRSRLSDLGSDARIETVRGVGYALR
jgi:two-component system response regulator MprA